MFLVPFEQFVLLFDENGNGYFEENCLSQHNLSSEALYIFSYSFKLTQQDASDLLNGQSVSIRLLYVNEYTKPSSIPLTIPI